MLSQEASSLTRLILTRHSLFCRAVELDVELEVLALLQTAPDLSLGPQAQIDADQRLDVRVDDALAESALLPALIAGLEGRISGAWARLHRASPCPRT
jgi:hypothetical protein